jgi:hypothetical protein
MELLDRTWMCVFPISIPYFGLRGHVGAAQAFRSGRENKVLIIYKEIKYVSIHSFTFFGPSLCVGPAKSWVQDCAGLNSLGPRKRFRMWTIGLLYVAGFVLCGCGLWTAGVSCFLVSGLGMTGILPFLSPPTTRT